MMSDRARRLGRIGATAAFGLLVFLLVLFLTLPYDRAKDYLVALADQAGYDVEIKSAGPALGLGVRLKDVTVATRPAGGGKPTRIVVPLAKLYWSLLGAMVGHKTYHLSANVLGGAVSLETTRSKKESNLHIEAKEIDVSEFPWVKAAINLPLSGTLELQLDEKMPGLRASATAGSLTWTCSACALGDGKAKLVVPGNPLLAEGLGLPKIRLGEFVGRVSIEKGVGRLQGVQAKSPDGELYLEGEIRLNDPLASSSLDLYIRFKLSDALLKSSEKLRTIMQFAGSAGKRPDGFYGVRISGPVAHLGQPVWTKTSPFGASTSGPKPMAAKPGAPIPLRPAAPPAAPLPAPPLAAPLAVVPPPATTPAATPPPASPPPAAPPPAAPPPAAPPPAAPPLATASETQAPPLPAQPVPPQPSSAPTPAPAPTSSPAPAPAPAPAPPPTPAAPGPAPPAAPPPTSSSPRPVGAD